MTFFIMAPTFQEVNKEALTPLFNDEINLEQAYEQAAVPFKEFMSKHTRQKDLSIIFRLCRSRSAEIDSRYSINSTCPSICN